MSEKQIKKLKSMAALFYQAQPPNMPNRKSLKQILSELKNVHKTKR